MFFVSHRSYLGEKITTKFSKYCSWFRFHERTSKNMLNNITEQKKCSIVRYCVEMLHPTLSTYNSTDVVIRCRGVISQRNYTCLPSIIPITSTYVSRLQKFYDLFRNPANEQVFVSELYVESTLKTLFSYKNQSTLYTRVHSTSHKLRIT